MIDDSDLAVFKRRIKELRLDSYNDQFLAVFHRIAERLEKLDHLNAEKGERCQWMSKTIDEIPNYRCMLPTHGSTIVYCPCNGVCGIGKPSTMGEDNNG